MPVRTVTEHGTKDKRSVAFALDWPGWSRGAKTAEEALATLEAYRARYRSVAELADAAAEPGSSGVTACPSGSSRASEPIWLSRARA